MADIAAMRGIPQLQRITTGDPGLTVALIDGPVDTGHPCFEGARITSVDPSGVTAHDMESWAGEHATFVASVLVGRPDSEVPGIAPECSVRAVVAAATEAQILDPANLARAVEDAVAAGVDVIHCAFCVPSQTNTDGGRLLAVALDRAREAGVPVVAPAGNDSGTAWCLPATSPRTLAVGSVDDDGVPAPSTNHGRAYLGHGVMANGTRILGAVPGGGTIRMKGTSCAAPVVTGVLLLLLSAMRQEGQPVPAFEAARAIVASATPYDGDEADARRCIGGILDPMAALELLRAGSVPSPAGPDTVLVTTEPGTARVGDRPRDPDADLPPRSPLRWDPAAAAPEEPNDLDQPGGDQSAATEQSLRLPARVYALGGLRVDPGSVAHRDRLARLLGTEGIAGPPEDPAALLELLARHPAEATGLVWVLTDDAGQPRYALRPEGAYAAQVWDLLVEGLTAFTGEQPPDRMSFPGVRVAEAQHLADGTPVPVLRLPVVRGIYAWTTEGLARAAAAGLGGDPVLVEDLADLLRRGYHDTDGAGDTAPARALNYALTNATALAWSLAQVRGTGRRASGIEVRRSTFARPYSDCWDVVLTFDDPDDERRARLVHRHAVDVADLVPVTVGTPKSWFEPPTSAT